MKVNSCLFTPVFQLVGLHMVQEYYCVPLS